MRVLPPDIDADAVIAIGSYLDAHGSSTPVSIRVAMQEVRRRVQTAMSDQALEELLVEMCSTRRLSVLFDGGAATADSRREQSNLIRLPTVMPAL